MKALVNEAYGNADVLQFKEMPRPVVGDDEVLIAVQASSINKAEWYLLNGRPYLLRLSPGGLRKPRVNILGGDIAGVVEAVGGNVTQFSVGDELYGDISDSGMGGYAEYVSAPAHVMAHKPQNLSFGEAAAVPSAAVTALQGIRAAGGVKPGQKVLVNGASGGVGTYVLQLAKMYGAEVTAVCSTSKIELVRSLGADHVIDYKQEDFTRSGRQYDLILAVNGGRSMTEYRRALTPRGICMVIGGTMSQIFQAMLLGPLLSRKDGQRILTMGATKINQQDLQTVAELLDEGQLSPVIERCFPFSEAIDAMREFGHGHAAGKLVITMEEGR